MWVQSIYGSGFALIMLKVRTPLQVGTLANRVKDDYTAESQC